MKGINGTSVIITGAGSGIGREAAVRFADAGAKVLVADVDEEGGRQTVATIEDAGGEAVFERVDVADPEETAAMVDRAVDAFGRLDCGINNAGIEGESLATAEYPNDVWERVIDVNLTGVWNSMRAELDQFLEQGDGGAIVNTSSILGKVGFEGASAYTASKHGVVGLTKNAAIEYAGKGIRVNAVCPGFIHTPMIERYGVTEDEETQEAVERMHPIGRLGEPKEIAGAMLWLCSEHASFVTGEAVNVDGGYLSR